MYELEEEAWGINAANPLDFYLTSLSVSAVQCVPHI